MDYHVTGLTSYNLCAYASKYSTSKPELSNTYKGDLLNVAATNNKDVDLNHLYKIYAKFIDSDISNVKKLKRAMEACREYVEELRTDIKIMADIMGQPLYFYQEMKMFYPMNDVDNIIWTPDLFYYRPDEDMRYIEDFKLSSKSWYGNEEILKYDCQMRAYPLFVSYLFPHVWNGKFRFRFNLYDKNTWDKINTGDITLTKEESLAYIQDVYDRMKVSEETDMWLPQIQPKCWFCDLKSTCPLQIAMKKNKSDDDFEDWFR